MSSKIVISSLVSMAAGIVDWKVFAAWVETEGSVDSYVDFELNPRTGTYYVRIVRSILIPQKERAPLAALQRFLTQEGVRSTIQFIKPSRTSFSKEPYCRLAIQRAEDIDKVVKNIKDYLLTQKTWYQIERYLHTRHMTASELRAEFLQSWFDSRRGKKRRGGKGHYVY